MDDPKAIVRRGYDLVSYAYRADDAVDGRYASWLELLDQRLPAGSHVLDLGCGNGVPIARRLAQRHNVVGVDFSPVQIARARELAPTATFVCADMSSVDFASASLDAVVCLYALIHVPRSEQPGILRSIRRWLRSDGLFIATVGIRDWTGIERDWLGVAGGDMWWSHADAATYRSWLGDAGLRIERESIVPDGDASHLFVLAVARP